MNIIGDGCSGKLSLYDGQDMEIEREGFTE